MLSNLVYVSHKTPECTSDELDKILSACQNNNGHIDATGVLLHSDTHFLQYLEGEYKTITDLYKKIKEDKRHKNVVLLMTGTITDRMFPSWQMGSKKFSDDNISYLTDMNAEEEREFTDLLAGKTEGSEKAVYLIERFFK